MPEEASNLHMSSFVSPSLIEVLDENDADPIRNISDDPPILFSDQNLKMEGDHSLSLEIRSEIQIQK